MHIFLSILLAVIFSLAQPVCPRAEVVGRFLKVEGPVDLLKQGQLPALTPKVQDGLEPGDVIQTNNQGRAQVRFVDDSVLTIAPKSKVGIESYMYDAAKGSRNAVLQVFQGLVKTAVSRIYKAQAPDFVMKTTTATLGIRGTEWYALLGENGTDVYNKSGRLSVRNINPQVGGEVFLNAMERTQIRPDLTPDTPQTFQMQDLAHFDQQLGDASASSGGGGSGGGSSGGGNTSPPGSFGGTASLGGASGVPPSNDLSPLSSFSGSPSGSSSLSPTESVIKQWTGASGWWDDSGVPSGTSNWTSAGVPLNGNSAFLTQTDSIDRTVRYNYTDPMQLKELRIDATGSGNMTLRQDSPSSLTADNEYVGYYGRGIFVQSAGKNMAIYGLYLGYNPGSSGIYTLQDGNLSAGVIRINSGGVLNQTGGTLESGGLDNRGTVNLSGGTTTVTGNTSNQGTVKVSNTFVTWAGTFINSGAYISDPATQSFTDLTITPTGYLMGGAGDRWEISNDFINRSIMGLAWQTLAANLAFTAGEDTAHNFYIPGTDFGPYRSGYANNFAWGRLDLTGQSLTLFDGNSQAGGALYVGELILEFTPEGLLLTVITGNGLNIYYDPELNPYLGDQIYDLMNGGRLIPLANPVPVPASAWLFLSGLAALGLERLRRLRRD